MPVAQALNELLPQITLVSPEEELCVGISHVPVAGVDLRAELARLNQSQTLP